MKVFQLFVIALVLIPIFAAPTVAQKERMLAVLNSKTARINSKTFEDKQSGIKDLVKAYDKIEVELKPQIDELNILTEKIQKTEKEILRLIEISKKDWTGHSNAYSEAKVEFEKYQSLGRAFKAKQEIYKSLYDKRESEIAVPIIKNITMALMQYAEQNGYTMVLNDSKNNFSAIVQEEPIDITKKFIQFYNDNSEKEKPQ